MECSDALFNLFEALTTLAYMGCAGVGLWMFFFFMGSMQRMMN